jgi:hypothetical protein
MKELPFSPITKKPNPGENGDVHLSTRVVVVAPEEFKVALVSAVEVSNEFRILAGVFQTLAGILMGAILSAMLALQPVPKLFWISFGVSIVFWLFLLARSLSYRRRATGTDKSTSETRPGGIERSRISSRENFRPDITPTLE